MPRYYAIKYKGKYVGDLGDDQQLFGSLYEAERAGYTIAHTKIPEPMPKDCTFEQVKVFTLPSYVCALLEGIESELDRIMWNINQEEYASPFRNTGNEFVCDTFEAHAYYWGDEERLIERPNFKCGDIEISWYKHLGRGDTINRPITPEEAIRMYNKCMYALHKYEKENDDDSFGY